MTKNLTRTGNSYAVVIDRPIMDLLNIMPDTAIEVTTEGGRIILTPVLKRPDKKQKVREARAWANRRYSQTLKKLAE
jgi:antitoxin MazE